MPTTLPFSARVAVISALPWVGWISNTEPRSATIAMSLRMS
jgi:hypothetical protein